MRHELMWDLADCTEFRQTLQARPPRIVHGTLLLLAALLATALAWAALTQADLVVRAPGRVRPVTSPMKVVNAGSGEVLSASVGGRVVAVNVYEGQEVRRGDILIRLDTERLDNEMTKRQRAIQASEEELTELGRLEQLLAHQFASTRAKAEAELAPGSEGSPPGNGPAGRRCATGRAGAAKRAARGSPGAAIGCAPVRRPR